MKQKTQVILLSAVVLALLAANVRLAFAKQWGVFHWHRGNATQPLTWGLWPNAAAPHWIEIRHAVGRWDAETNAAFLDNPGDPKGPDVTVISADYGCVPWVGLATIINPSECRVNGHPGSTQNPSVIEHVHVRYNTYWDKHPDSIDNKIPTEGLGPDGDILGIMLHELGHALGLDHSPDFCMGKGYFEKDNGGAPIPAANQNTTGMDNHNEVNANIP